MQAPKNDHVISSRQLRFTTGQLNLLSNISSMRPPDETLTRELKIFDELRGVTSGECCVECLILLLKQSDFRRRNQGCKKRSFSSDFQHSLNIYFLSIFSMN